jgi:hypothetical protein
VAWKDVLCALQTYIYSWDDRCNTARLAGWEYRQLHYEEAHMAYQYTGLRPLFPSVYNLRCIAANMHEDTYWMNRHVLLLEKHGPKVDGTFSSIGPNAMVQPQPRQGYSGYHAMRHGNLSASFFVIRKIHEQKSFIVERFALLDMQFSREIRSSFSQPDYATYYTTIALSTTSISTEAGKTSPDGTWQRTNLISRPGFVNPSHCNMPCPYASCNASVYIAHVPLKAREMNVRPSHSTE